MMLIPEAVTINGKCPHCGSTRIGKLLEAPTHGKCYNEECRGAPDTGTRMFWWDDRLPDDSCLHCGSDYACNCIENRVSND